MKRLKIALTFFVFCVVIFNYAQTNTALFDDIKLLEHIKTLSSDEFEGRLTGTLGNEKGRTYITEQFKSLNVQPFGDSYQHGFNFKRRNTSYEGFNVLGTIKGSEFPERYIVVSAHHDHLGQRNGRIYNGADDDASGVAALFAFAEYLTKNPPKHSVILAAFDAEELGLQGSKFFVEATKDKDIILNINMDMISRSSKDELYVVGSVYNENLESFLSKFQNPTTTKLLIGHDNTDSKQDWTYASDHASFHRAKLPFLYFGNEDHKDYHKPDDDYEYITPLFYKNAVTIILSVFQIIDSSGL